MSSTTDNGSEAVGGVIVILNWTGTEDWVTPTQEVTDKTGITSYKYTSAFYDNLLHFTLFIINTAPHIYTFKASNGEEKTIPAIQIGEHQVPPFTGMTMPKIDSVKLDLFE